MPRRKSGLAPNWGRKFVLLLFFLVGFNFCHKAAAKPTFVRSDRAAELGRHITIFALNHLPWIVPAFRWKTSDVFHSGLFDGK